MDTARMACRGAGVWLRRPRAGCTPPSGFPHSSELVAPLSTPAPRTSRRPHPQSFNPGSPSSLQGPPTSSGAAGAWQELNICLTLNPGLRFEPISSQAAPPDAPQAPEGSVASQCHRVARNRVSSSCPGQRMAPGMLGSAVWSAGGRFQKQDPATHRLKTPKP